MKTKFYSWFDNYTAKGSREMYCKDGWNASEKNRSGALDKRIKKVLKYFLLTWEETSQSGNSYCKYCGAEIFHGYAKEDNTCFHDKGCKYTEAKKLLKRIEDLEA